MSANDSTTTSTIETLSINLITYAVRQDALLKGKAKDIFKELVPGGADLATITANTQECFSAIRGEHLEAKTSGAKKRATEIGQGFARVKRALNYHFSEADLTVEWPAIITGGQVKVLPTETARDVKRALKEAQAEVDRADLAALQEKKQRAELNELREMGPIDLANALLEKLNAWSDDPTQKQAVLDLMQASVTTDKAEADEAEAAKPVELAEAA